DAMNADAGMVSHAVTADGWPAAEFGYHGPDAGCPRYRVPGSGAQVWLLRTQASVLAALRSPVIRDLRAITPAHALAGVTLQRPGGLLRLTSPQAEALRAVLNPIWRRAACEPYRPVLRALATSRAAVLGTSEPVDLIRVFITPYTRDLVLLAAGLHTPRQAATLIRLSDRTTGALLHTPADHPRVQAAWQELYAFTAEAINRARTPARRQPGPPATGALTAAGLPAGPSLPAQSTAALEAAGLPPAGVHEAVTTIYNGIPTTAPALARITAHLLSHPTILAACQASPALAGPVTAEAIRYAAHFTFALPGCTREPVMLDGTTIPAGAAVLPVIHAAEHDPARTAQPGRSALPRPHRATLAWGAGTHACLGRHLATIALEEAIAALASTGLRPAPGPMPWQPGTMPTPASLDVLP
ncbi:MAG TPA: cytochrome P450, partial [Streptosporangiaceae bacterium]|nr:cytochrome P450 [Streptosporangiaceae bacterium]